MKTININKLYIGTNSEKEFRLGLYEQGVPIIREILDNGDTITVAKRGFVLYSNLKLVSILFNDFSSEELKKPSLIFSNLEVSEKLVSEWASTIKNDEKFQQALGCLCDSRTSSGYREGAEKFIKKELLHSLLYDYACVIQSEKNSNNEIV